MAPACGVVALCTNKMGMARLVSVNVGLPRDIAWCSGSTLMATGKDDLVIDL